MLTFNTLFEKELKKLIVSAIEERKENLSTGLSTVDFETYKHQIGIIAGLRQALEMCEEATSICSRENRE
jgi:molybdopterin-guanine dinucleotide biosynthesis protein A